MCVRTLLDPADYPGDEIVLVYGGRWAIEVKIRDIKTTMKFEMMRVKSPAMAHRTMKLIQLAYNLVKARQAEAIKGEAIQLENCASRERSISSIKAVAFLPGWYHIRGVSIGPSLSSKPI